MRYHISGFFDVFKGALKQIKRTVVFLVDQILIKVLQFHTQLVAVVVLTHFELNVLVPLIDLLY